MPAEITETDGVFSVREPMWHGLGTVLPDYPTKEEAQAIAHPWEPVSERIFRQIPYIDPRTGGPATRFEVIEDQVLNVRSDNAFPLGVVTTTYEPVLNKEMYEIAEAIEGLDPGSVRYETGGSLKGGQKVWLLIRLQEPIVLKGDPLTATIPYYAIQNAHDGSSAFRGQGVMTRIVCDNTSRAADMEARARGTEFTFRHTKTVQSRIDAAKQALTGWRESIQAWRLINEELLTIKVDARAEATFVDRFIPMPPPHMYSEQVERNVYEARGKLERILVGPTCEGIRSTAYGLVQAAAEYDQHYRRAKSAETRFARAYLDSSKIMKDAVDIARWAVR